jgi:5,10-methylenetetrahydromethanopterin reductase
MAEFWQLTFPMPGRSEHAARAAENSGWDGLFFADTQCLSGDIYSAMCLAAKATTTLKVGTAVTNPVTRHAAVTASAIATVQVESHGRAVLGIGRGDSSLGYLGQRPAPASRLAQYVEQLQSYLKSESVDLDGFASHIAWIADSGQPKVPVDVASTGPRVIALAARLAERITFAMGADPVRITRGMADARRAAEEAGRDPDELSFGAYINIACDDDLQRARDIVRGSTGTFAHFSGMSTSTSAGLKDEPVFQHIGANYDMANHASGEAAHMQAVPDDFISRFAVVGPPGQCVDRLGELINLGLDRLVLLMGSRDANPEHVAASMERISNEVIVKLR